MDLGLAKEVFLDLKVKYGSIIIVFLKDYGDVPCKEMTWKEYMLFHEILPKNIFSQAEIEDAIFRHYVLDKYLIKTMKRLKAGDVSFIANSILNQSVPNSLEEVDEILEKSREALTLYDQFSSLILSVFPSITPAYLSTLSFAEITKFFVMAEQIRINSGTQDGPITLSRKPRRTKSKVKRQEQKGNQPYVFSGNEIASKNQMIGMTGGQLDGSDQKLVNNLFAEAFPEYLKKTEEDKKLK